MLLRRHVRGLCSQGALWASAGSSSRDAKTFGKLLKSRDLRGAKVVWEKMAAQKHVVKTMAENTQAVEMYCLLREWKQAIDLFHEEIELGRGYSQSELRRLMRLCVRHSNFYVAERVWGLYDLAKIPRSQDCYTEYILVAAERKDKQLALKVLDEMLLAGCNPTLSSFSALLRCSSLVGDYKWADKLLDEMRSTNIQPDQRSFAAVINAHVNGRDLQGAEQPYLLMKELGYTPKKEVLLAMLKLFSHAKNWKRGLEVWNEIDSYSWGKNTNLVRAGMFFFSQFGEVSRVKELFNSIVEAKSPVTMWHIQLLLRACVNAKNVQEFEIAWKIMETMGLAPTQAAYVSRISLFISLQDLQKAIVAFDEMLAFGIPPSRQTATLLLKGCTDSAHETVANKVMLSLSDHHVTMDIPLCNSLLSFYARSGNLEKAFEVLQRALNLKLELDAQSFNALFTAVAVSADASREKELLQLMSESEVKPNVFLYNTLIHVHVRLGRLKNAVDTLDHMHNAGLPPSSDSFNTVLKACQKNANVKLMGTVLDKMKSYAVSKDRVTFTTMLDVYARKGKRAEFDATMESMRLASVDSDPYVLNAALKLCRVLGEADLVLEYWVAICNDGVEPNSHNYNSLIDVLASSGNTTAAVSKFLEMINRGVKPDIYTATTMGTMYLKSHCPQKALECWIDMYENYRIDISLPMLPFRWYFLSHASQGEHEEFVRLCMKAKTGIRPQAAVQIDQIIDTVKAVQEKLEKLDEDEEEQG